MCCCFLSPTTTDSAFSKLFHWRTGGYVMCTLIVERFSTQIMHIIGGTAYKTQAGWFLCFCLSRIWGKPFVSTQATATWSLLWISLTKCVDRNTWTPFCTEAYQKKQESHPILATSFCHSLIFAVSFSFIICCLLPLYHEDIFEKRNVHECLQCPPHWNTWGKVSSLTLWSIPAPQLEPQRLVPLRMRIFVSRWWAIFLTKGLLVELELL